LFENGGNVVLLVVAVVVLVVVIALQKFSESMKEFTRVVSPQDDFSVVVVEEGMYAGLHFGRCSLEALAQYFVQRRVR
jgi:hypothetical protein